MVEALATRASAYQSRSRHTCPVCPVKVGVIDYKQSLSIDHQSGWWRCYRCQFKGRLPGFEDSFVEEPDFEDQEWRPMYEFEEPSDYNPVADDPSVALKVARAYLKSRGVSKTTAREAQIGFALEGSTKGRVITPFLDHDGCWMGWQGRAIRYKSYHTRRDPASLFWNEPAIMEDTREPLMVVEGVYDALPYWPNAVAGLGKPYGLQLDLLAQAKRPLAFVLDSDAHLYSESLANELERCGLRTLSVRLSPGADPSNVQHQDLWQAIKTALE